MRQERVLVISVLFIIAICFIAFNNHINHDWKLRINEDGGIYFLRNGWFKNDKCPIEKRYGEWYWLPPDQNWVQIAVPFQAKYNDIYLLVLDRHGAAYLMTKNRLKAEPLKVIDGKWCRYADGEWLEIPFDLP